MKRSLLAAIWVAFAWAGLANSQEPRLQPGPDNKPDSKPAVEQAQPPHEIVEAWELGSAISIVAIWEPKMACAYVVPFWRFHDPGVARVLLDLLDTSPPLLQHYFIRKLAALRQERAVGKLLHFAKSGDPWWVQSIAIEALGLIGHPSAIPALIQLLEQPQPMVRKRTIAALKNITHDGPDFTTEQATQAVLYWKEWGVTRGKEYAKYQPPIDDLPYWDPVTALEILRPAPDWQVNVTVNREQHSLSFRFRPPNKEIAIRVWAEPLVKEESEPPRKTKSAQPDVPSDEVPTEFRREIAKIEMQLRRKTKTCVRLVAKPWQYRKLNGCRLLHHITNFEDKATDYASLIFLSPPYAYYFLASAPSERQNEAVNCLQQLLNFFQIKR